MRCLIPRQNVSQRIFSLIVLLMLTRPIAACPMCKDGTVSSDKPTVASTAGVDFNRSIYIMLGGFSAVLGVTGTVIYRAVKSS